jgi:hypothetical protein
LYPSRYQAAFVFRISCTSEQSYSSFVHGLKDHSPHLPLQEISIEENLQTPRGRKERNPFGNYLESVAYNTGGEENNKPMLMCTHISYRKMVPKTVRN